MHKTWLDSFAVAALLFAGAAVAQGYLGDVAIEERIGNPTAVLGGPDLVESR